MVGGYTENYQNHKNSQNRGWALARVWVLARDALHNEVRQIARVQGWLCLEKCDVISNWQRWSTTKLTGQNRFMSLSGGYRMAVMCKLFFTNGRQWDPYPDVVSQARLSLGRRESGQIPIRLLYCILSNRVPNEVSVNINWDAFWKSRFPSF